MRDWTEGVPHTIHWPFLRRNIPNLESEDDFGKAFLPFFNEDGLCVRIAPETYRLMWEKFTTDWWVHERKVRSRGMKGMVNLMEQRKSKFEEKFIENARWMAGLSLDSVNKKKAEFHQLVHGEAPATKQAEEGESNKDTTMGGT